MRRCIVSNCINTDHIILCHRFPKNRTFGQKWQISLNLIEYPLETLVSKYTVCSQHFDCTDYRNPSSKCLNATAVPKLQGINPRPYAALRTKNAPLEPQYKQMKYADNPTSSSVNSSNSIELLHRDDDATEIEESLISNSEEMYIMHEDELKTADELIQSIDGTDFTMLDAAGCAMYMPTMGEQKTLDTTGGLSPFIVDSDDSSRPEFRPGSTDSDVEVLVSEAVFESQWSETDHSAVVLNTGDTNTNSESAVSPCISYHTDVSTKTENDLGVTMLDSELGHLDRFQLMDIIKSQSMKIDDLERKINHFNMAQNQFFTQVDAFRSTVCGIHM